MSVRLSVPTNDDFCRKSQMNSECHLELSSHSQVGYMYLYRMYLCMYVYSKCTPTSCIPQVHNNSFVILTGNQPVALMEKCISDVDRFVGNI